MKESVKQFSIIKFIISILLIIMIAIAFNHLIRIYLISDTYEDNFIGSFEDIGRVYRSYNNLFTFNNHYSGINRRYYKDFINDGIDESGYQLSYQIQGHDSFHLMIYRELWDNDRFKIKAMKVAGQYDSLLSEPYFEDFEKSGYYCTFHSLLLPADKEQVSDSLMHKEVFSILFCANDSISFMLKTNKNYKVSLNDIKFDESIMQNEKRMLCTDIEHKLIFNEQLFKKGIPKSLSENELRKFRVIKRIKRIIDNILTFGRTNYKKQDKVIRRIRL